MENESLRYLKTMRQVRTSLALARAASARTANSLGKPEDREVLPDARLEQVLDKERRRMAAYEASVARSRGRLLRLRDNLARVIRRNRALTELRRELQESRWRPEEPAGKISAPAGARGVEFRY